MHVSSSARRSLPSSLRGKSTTLSSPQVSSPYSGPGGIGTLDELIETLVLVKLGRLDCRIAAVNVDGFYDPLKALLDHYVATNMLEPADRALISFPSTVEEFEALL